MAGNSQFEKLRTEYDVYRNSMATKYSGNAPLSALDFARYEHLVEKCSKIDDAAIPEIFDHGEFRTYVCTHPDCKRFDVESEDKKLVHYGSETAFKIHHLHRMHHYYKCDACGFEGNSLTQIERHILD